MQLFFKVCISCQILVFLMISLSFLKKMNVESFPNPWRTNLSCEKCSVRLSVFRKKKICFFCKYSFCEQCIMRREDKKFCCRKCQILTARPLNRNELLNLRSRDLVNYLTSRHISTNGCVEKEDLVNVLMRAVNNSCFHPSSSAPLSGTSCANSYPSTPRNHSFTTGQSNSKRKLSQSVDHLFNDDGIRITGHNVVEDDVYKDESSTSGFRDTPSQQSNEGGQSSHLMSDDDDDDDDDVLSSQNPTNERIEETLTDLSSDKNDELAGQNDECTDSNKPLMLSDIKNSEDLDALSVKQLKELLMRNRTDFKGCIERTELLQKANRLWKDYILSRKDLDNLSLDELCKICMDAPIECVLLECGHMATCTSCGKQLCECPICRQFVVRCVRTFKA